MSDLTIDRLSGLLVTVLGVLVLWGALEMPRFENQGASIYQAPGLTPGLLGLALAIAGLCLALRRPAGAAEKRGYWSAVFGDRRNRIRALVAVFLTLVYGLALFGNINFTIGTALFVFCFTLVFELWFRDDGADAPPLAPTLLIAATVSCVAAFAIRYMLQSVFLIQLP